VATSLRGRPPVTSRAAVVGAAVRVFDRDGLAGLTMRAVAAEAGIGLATLYGYVPDKEALLDLVLAAVERDLPAHLVERAAGLHDWVDGIQLWVHATWTEATQHPGVLDLMAGQRYLPRGTGARGLLVRILHLAEREGVAVDDVAFVLKTASDFAIGLAALRRLDPGRPVLDHLLPERAATGDDSDGVGRIVEIMARVGDDVEGQLTSLVTTLCGRRPRRTPADEPGVPGG
jgi:AcrR family transcriptional regulator